MDYVVSQSNTVHASLGVSRWPGKTVTVCGMNLSFPQASGEVKITCRYCSSAIKYGDAMRKALLPAPQGKGLRKVSDLMVELNATKDEVRECVASLPDLSWLDQGAREMVGIVVNGK